MNLDILAFGIHPDDVELSCGGTIAKHVSLGYQVGICDLTAGEMGTRGNAILRIKESNQSSQILGVHIRENLGMKDVWALDDQESTLKIIQTIRKYRPKVVFCNARQDRHPDHAKGAEMVQKACFLSGLLRIETFSNEQAQQHFRPQVVYNYIQFQFQKPDFVVDISNFVDKKFEAIQAYRSQFFDPSSNEEETFISQPDFLEVIRSNDQVLGKSIGVKFAEGFHIYRHIGVNNIMDLL